MLLALNYIEYLYRALNSPVGIAIVTNDADKLRRKLYTLMSKDESFKKLSLHLSPTHPNGELWIVKKEKLDENRASKVD